ncbi:MAG TPA: hypothetical protein DEF85_06330 [Clostridiaceae bacterium]|jgi:MFS family permease|nr:hypothetical protein [Clostridiaceae bacterium]HBX48490.1 hypothetical protein [Clostridiaceae bacterium]HCL50908.1 hypothetical protein [Clostridiaceae bacterium]
MRKYKFPVQIKFIIASMILGSLQFESSILMIYYQEQSLSNTQVGTMMAAYSIAVIIFEYITGIWADQYGPKKIYTSSILILILGESLLIIGKSYIIIFSAIIFIALSVAAKSGADIALLYNKLEEQNKKEMFNYLIGTIKSISLILGSLVVMIGSILGNVNIKIPFIATVICNIIAFLLMLNVHDEKKVMLKKHTSKLVLDGFNVLKENKLFLWVTCSTILIFPLNHILSIYLQVYMEDISIPTMFFGTFYAVSALSEALGSKLSNFVIGKLGCEKAHFLSGVLIIIAFGMLYIKNIIVFAVIFMIISFLFGIYYISNTIIINSVATSENRATLMSEQHALTKISTALFMYLVGFGTDRIEINILFLCISLLILVPDLLLTSIYFIKYKKEKDVIER